MSDTTVREAIANKCPSCGWKSLFIGSGGWITCGNITDCKYPDLDDAIMQLLAAEQVKLLERLKAHYSGSIDGIPIEAIDAELAALRTDTTADGREL